MCIQSNKTLEPVTHAARKLNVQFSQPCGVSVNYHDKLKCRCYPPGVIHRSYLIAKTRYAEPCLWKISCLTWRWDCTVPYLGERPWPWQYGSPTVINLWIETDVFQLRKHSAVDRSSSMWKLIQLHFLFYIRLWYKLNTLQMVTSRKKGKTIHSEAREIINDVNHHCKQEAVEKSLILCLFAVQMTEKRTVVECRLQQRNRLDGRADREIMQS
jgi:hypothetical protein